MSRRLDGKVALVTGATQGLGRSCAQSFAREGAKVAVVGRNRDNGEETVRLIRDAGGEALFVAADVADEGDVRSMIEATIAAYGRLDCAVNNAVATIPPTPLADIDAQAWRKLMSVNLDGVFLCMKYEIRAMLDQGGGAIVNVGSGNEHSAMPGLSWYLAAKQAMYAMTKVAALDYGAQGIRVNAVAPGTMWTPLLRQAAAQDPAHVERRVARAPIKRLAEPEEVAEAIVWLCGPSASYVLGHTMLVDGGFVLG